MKYRLDENYKIEVKTTRTPVLQYDFLVFNRRGQVAYAFIEVSREKRPSEENISINEAYWIDIVVNESFWRQGIGSKTVQFIIQFLIERGVKRILGNISSTDDTNRAIYFWRKNGFFVNIYSNLLEILQELN